MRSRSNIVWLLVLPLCACAVSPPLPQQLVSVGAVMNSLMCGMVKAHQNPEAARFLNGQRASVSLELKIVNSSTAGISVGGGGGGGGGGSGKSSGKGGGGGGSSNSVIAFQGLSLTPSLTASFTQGWTVDTTTNVTFAFPDNPSLDANICQAKEDLEDLDQFGFSRWLGDTLSGLAKVSDISGSPIPAPKLSYDANFGVQSGINGSLTIVPLTGLGIPITPNGGYSRNDIQHLTISIPPVQRQTGGGGGSPIILFSQPANAPVLSLRNIRRLPE